MKQALIFLHGNHSKIPDLSQFPRKDTFIICADGGAMYAMTHQLVPDVVIGDFDSIDDPTEKKLRKLNVPLIRYPREKDYTDSELAIRYALDKGIKRIYVCGFFGARIDHLLANVGFFAQLTEKAEIRILEGDMEVRYIRKRGLIRGKKGDEVSLIPLTGQCKKIRTHNLCYPLKNETLLFGSTRGISNILEGPVASITLSSGILLVVHTRKGL